MKRPADTHVCPRCKFVYVPDSRTICYGCVKEEAK